MRRVARGWFFAVAVSCADAQSPSSSSSGSASTPTAQKAAQPSHVGSPPKSEGRVGPWEDLHSNVQRVVSEQAEKAWKSGAAGAASTASARSSTAKPAPAAAAKPASPAAPAAANAPAPAASSNIAATASSNPLAAKAAPEAQSTASPQASKKGHPEWHGDVPPWQQGEYAQHGVQQLFEKKPHGHPYEVQHKGKTSQGNSEGKGGQLVEKPKQEMNEMERKVQGLFDFFGEHHQGHVGLTDSSFHMDDDHKTRVKLTAHLPGYKLNTDDRRKNPLSIRILGHRSIVLNGLQHEGPFVTEWQRSFALPKGCNTSGVDVTYNATSGDLTVMVPRSQNETEAERDSTGWPDEEAAAEQAAMNAQGNGGVDPFGGMPFPMQGPPMGGPMMMGPNGPVMMGGGMPMGGPVMMGGGMPMGGPVMMGPNGPVMMGGPPMMGGPSGPVMIGGPPMMGGQDVPNMIGGPPMMGGQDVPNMVGGPPAKGDPGGMPQQMMMGGPGGPMMMGPGGPMMMGGPQVMMGGPGGMMMAMPGSGQVQPPPALAAMQSGLPPILQGLMDSMQGAPPPQAMMGGGGFLAPRSQPQEEQGIPGMADAMNDWAKLHPAYQPPHHKPPPPIPQDANIDFVGCFGTKQLDKDSWKYYGDTNAAEFISMYWHAKKDHNDFFAMTRHAQAVGHAYTFSHLTHLEPMFGVSKGCYTPCEDDRSRSCGCAHRPDRNFPNFDCGELGVGAEVYAVYKIKSSNSTRRSNSISIGVDEDEAPPCMWRQTGGCMRTGPREPDKDQFCSAIISNRASGFCDCNGNNVHDEHEHGYDCGSGPGRCDVVCQAAAKHPHHKDDGHHKDASAAGSKHETGHSGAPPVPVKPSLPPAQVTAAEAASAQAAGSHPSEPKMASHGRPYWQLGNGPNPEIDIVVPKGTVAETHGRNVLFFSETARGVSIMEGSKPGPAAVPHHAGGDKAGETVVKPTADDKKAAEPLKQPKVSDAGISAEDDEFSEAGTHIDGHNTWGMRKEDLLRHAPPEPIDKVVLPVGVTMDNCISDPDRMTDNGEQVLKCKLGESAVQSVPIKVIGEEL